MSPSKQPAILITGASGGIGFATLLACIQQGWHVFAACRSLDKLKACIDAFGQMKAEQSKQESRLANSLTMLEYDVSNAQSIKNAFRQIQTSDFTLAGLVNCAGVMNDAPLLMQTNDDFAHQMNVNVAASLNHIQFASRLMGREKQGSIVNLSSIVGIEGSEGQVAYAATKAAVIGMTKSAAKELAPLGIRVNAVAPGFIATPLTEHYDEKKQTDVLAKIKLGRLGQAEDVANSIIHLLKAESAYISGQVIRIDGLMSL
jgi:3-oxoacyl-[acyl-carrier protein] reductase